MIEQPDYSHIKIVYTIATATTDILKASILNDQHQENMLPG